MSIEKSLFGKMNDGTEVDLYKITNKSGAFVCLQTLGAGIQSIMVPDKNGILGDVILGFDEPQPYAEHTGYQGLVVGRIANRIRGAKFSIDGVEYNTPMNGESWTLHSGGRISHNVWDVVETTDNSVTFEYFSPDMEDGFPGNLTFRTKYTFTDDNTLRLEYTFLSDKKTAVNPTNHGYFNLSADPAKTIEDHYLWIDADKFTETDETITPTGKLLSVEGTPLDFRTMTRIGERIDDKFEFIQEGSGYDNNWCLNSGYGALSADVVLWDKESGRKLTVATDLPGVQVYCAGWISKEGVGSKGDSKVAWRRGAALETQFYPDSVNLHKTHNFPFAYVEANKEFKTTTEFRFTVE